MRLTGKQRRVLGRVLAYCDHWFTPSREAVGAFFAYTDRGERPVKWPLGTGELMRAWSWCYPSRDSTGEYGSWTTLQEREWLSGHFSGDYSLGALEGDILEDIKGGGDPDRRGRDLALLRDVRKLRVMLEGKLGESE